MGARNGEEYLSGLKDERQVWVNGERVSDVTTHTAFRGSVQGMAKYFDWQLAHRNTCLFDDPEFGAIGISHLIPRSPEDLARRHLGLEQLARYSVGMLGRTPDYVNVTFAGFSGLSHIWAANGNEAGRENLIAFQRECAERDLSLTHTIVHPSVDQRLGEYEGRNGEVALRKIGETNDSIVVSGSRLLATLAPFADEIAVYPGTPVPASHPEAALSFSVPLGTPGIRVLCRDHLGRDGSRFDRPFSPHFDEQDAFLIFDEVHVPKHRVFLDCDPDIYNQIRDYGWMPNVMQQTCIRAQVKLEFAFELCTRMANALGTADKPEVTAQLGEIWSYAELVRAGVRAAEADARDFGHGTWLCAPEPFLALRPTIPRWMVRVNEIIKTLGAHNLLATPSEADFNDSVIGPDVKKYLAGADVDAKERARLFRTAWDLVGSGLGSRGELYEQFYLGSSPRNYRTANRVAQQSTWEQLPAFFARTDLDDASP